MGAEGLVEVRVLGGAVLARNKDMRSSRLPTPTESPWMSLALRVDCARAVSAVRCTCVIWTASLVCSACLACCSSCSAA